MDPEYCVTAFVNSYLFYFLPVRRLIEINDCEGLFVHIYMYKSSSKYVKKQK